MKLDVAVNEVTLSNVGATGEFRIRNSAKAFKILSDGLYSNKIRAIIRELSCNAVDSHIGAKKADVPFEVHIPTALEPWFSVRDFGLGLSGDQVMNIYTTYFESTKTDSNEFIGALGLGSKSPFSYTENFTVTAIKNGIKRIYSAFINDQGVPSVTEMGEEITDEGNGVEVKFSVTDRYHYNSFRFEAIEVFKWFKNKPTITGADTELSSINYKEENIVPGVHLLNNGGASIALMGNIPYPLSNIPEVSKNFGDVGALLECGLVLEFDIGELDFAASREYLSFIPLTLNNIKRKLELLNSNLEGHLSEKINEIKGNWKKAIFLYEQATTKLYGAAVKKYVTNTKFKLYDHKEYYGHYSFKLPFVDLDTKKLEIKAFQVYHGASSKIGDHHYIDGLQKRHMQIPVSSETVIVLNDLKTGCYSRARYHFVHHNDGKRTWVYCFTHQDPDLSVRQKAYDQLIEELDNPPYVIKASELEKQIRATPVKTQGIMTLDLRSGRRTGLSESYAWNIFNGTINDNEIYYYVCLNNCNAIMPESDSKGNDIPLDVHSLKAMIDASGIEDLKKIRIFGIRKNRYKELKELDNWIWFEDKLKEEVAKISDSHIASLVAVDALDSYNNRVYTNKTVANLVGPDSYYYKFVNEMSNIKRIKGDVSYLVKLCSKYGKSVQVDIVRKKIDDAKNTLLQKYPMIKYVSEPKHTDIVNYIKLVDQQEKINE